MEDEETATARMKDIQLEGVPGLASLAGRKDRTSATSSPDESKDASRGSSLSPDDRKPRSDSASTPDNSQPPKSLRKASQKPIKREPQLYDHFPDMTQESRKAFQLISDCLYGSKHMGSTDNDALDCDCREDWHDGENHACDEDSGCINRLTKVECVAGANTCGDACQNQRFQRKQYADVSVIKTEKKGFGLRSNADLQANDFIFEYIGEVINEATFRRRMIQYDQEGIKHFYFMSLTKTEFVDATKRGNLGRFCNHSCRPNCYVDKWIVGDKLRMGIFAQRPIKAGEELVFNYNVDRYGADPQPCYCGEDNCTGFIGGKTQTERATKLPMLMAEALGIDDADSWDTTVAKKPRKKKADEDDEDYVNSVEARSLDEDGAQKVMAALMQCKEKWIAVKLLQRIQECDEERVIHCVMRMHAYKILRTTLNNFTSDDNVVLQVLDVLKKFPRLTRNKIIDSKIEATIESLTKSAHQEVASESAKLLEDWSKLEVAYRIQRRKGDPNSAQATNNSFHDERRNAAKREEEQAAAANKTQSLLNGIEIPKGPRSSIPQRNTNFYNAPRPRRPPNLPLPDGWFTAKDQRGNTYYYSKKGKTTWQRPTKPAEAPVAPVSAAAKAKQEEEEFQSIISKLSKAHTPQQSATQTPQQAETPSKENKKEKWRSLPIDKQMKIYENTMFQYVKPMTDKYRKKLPKDDLKRLAREINKKLVASDYKNNRVKDPTAPLGEKEERKVKKYLKEFFEKAVAKYTAHEQRKKEKDATNAGDKGDDKVKPGQESAEQTPAAKDESMMDVDDLPVSDDDSPTSMEEVADRKRKRELDLMESPADVPGHEEPFSKRVKEEDAETDATPPPPPPPPPDVSMEGTPDEVMTEEERAMREQEAALMLENEENEEAERLEEEAQQSSAPIEAARSNSASAQANGTLNCIPGPQGGGHWAHGLETDSPALEDEAHLPPGGKQEVLIH